LNFEFLLIFVCVSPFVHRPGSGHVAHATKNNESIEREHRIIYSPEYFEYTNRKMSLFLTPTFLIFDSSENDELSTWSDERRKVMLMKLRLHN
jgi:hypothetical protein